MSAQNKSVRDSRLDNPTIANDPNRRGSFSKELFLNAPGWDEESKDQRCYEQGQHDSAPPAPLEAHYAKRDSNPDINSPPALSRLESRVPLEKGKSIIINEVETDQDAQGIHSNVDIDGLVSKATTALTALATLNMLYDQYQISTNTTSHTGGSGSQNKPATGSVGYNELNQTGSGPQSILNVVQTNPELLGSILTTAQKAFFAVQDLRQSGAKSITSTVINDNYQHSGDNDGRGQHQYQQQHPTNNLNLGSISSMLEGLLNTHTPQQPSGSNNHGQSDTNMSSILNFIGSLGTMLNNDANIHNQQQQQPQPQPPPPQHQQQGAMSGLMGTLGAAAIGALGKGMFSEHSHNNRAHEQMDHYYDPQSYSRGHDHRLDESNRDDQHQTRGDIGSTLSNLAIGLQGLSQLANTFKR